MLLRLYREPYMDPEYPGRMRLLFERDPAGRNPGETASDFYLYAWVRACAALSAFQAVLDNEIVLNFDEEGHLVCGRIATGPVNRMVVPESDGPVQERVTGILRTVTCPVFGNLIDTVKACVTSDKTPSLRLSPAEAKLCRALTHGWRRNKSKG